MSKFRKGDRVAAVHAIDGGEWLNVPEGTLGYIVAALGCKADWPYWTRVYLVKFHTRDGRTYVVCIGSDLVREREQ